MKTDLLKKLLNELGVVPIPKDSVFLAMKKAVNNPIYWFCFKHKDLIGNIKSIATILSVVCIIVLFIVGAFISLTSFSGWFINNHIGMYLFLGLCVTLVVVIALNTISIKIASWNKKVCRHRDISALGDPFRKVFERFENVVDHSSEYYRKGVCLLEQHINKSRFIYVKDNDNNHCCININVAT